MKKLILILILLLFATPAYAGRMVAIYGDGNPFLLEQLLIKGQNALAEQSRPERKTIKSLYRGFNKRKIFSKNYKKRLKEGNVDGWGMVYYNPKLHKACSLAPAYRSFKYSGFVKYIVAKKPKIVLAHIRSASDKSTVKSRNTHPFKYAHWSFMHNGILENIDLNGLAKYDVDSEKAFRFIIFEIAKKYNKDPKDIRIKDVGLCSFKAMFAKLIKQLVRHSDKNYVANFVITDGETIMAYKDGAELFIGEYKGNTILSSEIIQPYQSKDIKWRNAPSRKVIVIN